MRASFNCAVWLSCHCCEFAWCDPVFTPKDQTGHHRATKLHRNDSSYCLQLSACLSSSLLSSQCVCTSSDWDETPHTSKTHNEVFFSNPCSAVLFKLIGKISQVWLSARGRCYVIHRSMLGGQTQGFFLLTEEIMSITDSRVKGHEEITISLKPLAA